MSGQPQDQLEGTLERYRTRAGGSPLAALHRGLTTRKTNGLWVSVSGFTGTSAFFQLVDQYPVNEITIFETTGEFGPGYPYRVDDSADYLLNNTNDTLCLVPSNRRAFLRWLETKPAYAGKIDPRGHLPRAVFGAFLKEAYEAARISAAVKGIKVTLVPHEATAMAEMPDGRVKITSPEGEVLADAALLATGRCPDQRVYQNPPTGSRALYVANHIRTEAMDQIALDATVHVLGSSLSAYDVINRLFSENTGCRFIEDGAGQLTFVAGPNERRVVLCSRSGRLKAVRSRSPMKIGRKHLIPQALAEKAGEGRASLQDLQAAVLSEAADHHVTLSAAAVLNPYDGCRSADDINLRAGQLLEDAIQSPGAPTGGNFLVDLFSDAQIDLWDGWAAQLLSPEARAQYRAKIESAVLSYSAPCPLSTAQKLLALHRAGRLMIRKGVSDVKFDEAEDCYLITHAFGTDRAKVLVNTTGSVIRDVESPHQPPLVRSLALAGVLRRDPQGLGASVDMETFRLNGARNIYAANMMLWGPGFFTSSAFMMALVVERLLGKMFADDA